MKRLLFALATLPLLAGAASAAQPVALSDTQMDAVTAGVAQVFLFSLTETDITNTSTVMINVDPVDCTSCYLNIRSEALTVQAQFGPAAGSNNFVFQSHGP